MILNWGAAQQNLRLRKRSLEMNWKPWSKNRFGKFRIVKRDNSDLSCYMVSNSLNSIFLFIKPFIVFGILATGNLTCF